MKVSFRKKLLKHKFLVLFTLLFVVSLEQSFSQPVSLTKEGPLDFYKSIKLSEDVPVGSVRYLDVSSDGEFLVSDVTANALYLFGSDGKFKKEITPESCHPGITWSPVRGKFVGQNKIFVANSTLSYLFDSNGECESVADATYTPLTDFCSFSGSDEMYGIRVTYPKLKIRKVTSKGVMLKESSEIPTSMPIIDSRISGGGISCDETTEKLKVVFSSQPVIYVYDKDLNFIETIETSYSLQKTSRDDFPSDEMAMMKAVSTFFRDRSHTMLASEGSEGEMMMLHSLRPGYILHVVDSEGVTVFEGYYDKAFYAKLDDKVYSLTSGQVNAAGELPNPSIEIYKIPKR